MKILQPYGGVAQLGEHLPCKQGVMGSNPIISTSEPLFAKMFIENRINKRNETDSCNMILIKESHREKLVIRIVCKETNLVKGFSVQVYG